MPVRWNPLAVSLAMDEVEGLLAQARPFLAQAREKCEQASQLPHIPQYMQGRISWVTRELDRTMAATRNVQRVREELPQDQLKKLQAGHSLSFEMQLPKSICDDGTIAVRR
jgi:hypothetical protein